MSKTLKSISFKNSILSKLHLNSIDQNPICPVGKKYRTNTNKISKRSLISIQEEIYSAKSIKPYNTQRLIQIQQSDYQISTIAGSQTYKKLHSSFLSMMSSHKMQKAKLKKQIKEIDQNIKQQSQKTVKFVNKYVQISQSYETVQNEYYEVRRKNYGLRCQLFHRRETQSQANWINHFSTPVQQINLDLLSYEEILQLEERVGKQSTGLSLQKMKKLKEIKLKEIISSLDKKPVTQKQEVLCCICCDNIDEEDKVIRLDCSHIHHGQCLKKWLNIQKFCPLCKREVGVS